MLKLDLVKDSVISLNAKKQAEKHILNMVMVFKALKIVCCNASYETASLGFNGSRYRNMKISVTLWP